MSSRVLLLAYATQFRYSLYQVPIGEGRWVDWDISWNLDKAIDYGTQLLNEEGEPLFEDDTVLFLKSWSPFQ